MLLLLPFTFQNKWCLCFFLKMIRAFYSHTNLADTEIFYRSMFGDDALGSLNIEMVEVARRVGAASKFTGSGGAVVVFCPDGPPQVKLLEDACKEAGFVIQPVKVVPSYLNEDDLKTLPG